MARLAYAPAMASAGLLVPVVLALGLFASACGGAEPAPVAPTPRPRNTRVGPRSRTTLLRPGLINRAPRAAEDKQLDPEARRFLLAHLAEPAAPASKEPPPMVTAVGLESTAEGEAAGLSPEGPVTSARLAEGQRLELPWTLPAAGCVTFIAQGGLGTTEVDLFLGTGAGEALTILAQDEQQGPVAVIGGRKGCFRNARRAAVVTGTLFVVLRRGAGPVLVRGYRRDAAAPEAPAEKK